MKIEAIIVGHNVYIEVDGKKIAVLYGIVKKELGVSKLYLSNENGLVATIFNATVKEDLEE